MNAENYTVITVNQRLSDYIQREYDHSQHQQGLKTWESIDSLPLTAWFERCYQALLREQADLPMLLNIHQSRILWQKCILAHASDLQILNIKGLLNEIIEAWQLLHNWNLTLNSINFEHSSDGIFFKKIANEYLNILNSSGWIDANLVPSQLISKCKTLLKFLPSPEFERFFHNSLKIQGLIF